ncbi:hypothetical protein CcrColossus_gp343 [Caulobacter phage CcrColossus]|uniref:Uncharacterized protein n=1 Tax=Caulobacter phage CcrColossus TaxID=1211640 RepID=K4JWD2_9CAUD|nr:hypothetical protein CcrColossus_gp343 [Caulobacter phage CcrColossus]AFU88213.1 hypothetical protein CcrColossus_gp343 [Caulobacter phage CcrColossus]
MPKPHKDVEELYAQVGDPRFMVRRLQAELGDDMRMPDNCRYCGELTPRHNPTCSTLIRKGKRA